MNRSFTLLIFLLLTNFSIAQIRHVIVIGVDGLGAYGIRHSNTPVMDSMMTHGAWTLKARSLTPTLSSPNWASVLMGVKPNEHYIKKNDWQEAYVYTQNLKKRKTGDTYPTVFKIFRMEDSLSDVAVFYQWYEFERLIEPGVSIHKNHFPNEDTVASRAITYMMEKKPRFMFVHLDLVDYAGHHYGLKSKEYKASVQKTDSLLGEFFSAIRKAGLSDSTVLLLTSDHGFIGKHHGGFTGKEKKIPFLIIGKSIRNGYEIKTKVTNADITPTLAYFFSFSQTPYWSGKPIKIILDNQNTKVSP